MKKIFSLLASFLLILQMFLPQVVSAQATDDIKEENGVTLTNVIVKEGASDYTVMGSMRNDTEDAITGEITISENLELSMLDDGAIFDGNKQEIGKYTLNGNVVSFSISAKMNTVFNFRIAGSYDGKVDKATFSDGTHVISRNIGKVDEETLKSDVPVQKPDVKQQIKTEAPVLKEGPQDLKDIFASLGYAEQDQSILSDMVVTYTNKDGEVVTEPTVDDRIHFAFDWRIPDDVGALVNEGDYYTFELPDNVKVAQNMTIDLGEYGKAVVNKDGTVTITFTDAVKGSSDVHGTLHFEAGFDENVIDGPGDTTIKVPGEEKLPSTEVTIKPKAGATIDKDGYFDKVQNPDYVIWNVDINKAMDTIENAHVTEALPDGLTFDSVQVYQVDVDLRGNVIAGSEKLVTTGYQVDADGNVTFTDSIDGAYRLVYKTTIQEDKKPLDGGKVKFENRATLSGKDVEDVTATATVEASYGKILSKSSTNYDPNKQVFEWTIKYNYGEKHIDQSDAVLTDTFGSERMVLLTDSVRLYNVTFNQDGKEVQGAELVAGKDYELIETEKGFEIRFLHDVDGGVKIKYKTGIDGHIDEDINVSNGVDISTGQHGGSTGTVYQQNLVKKLGAVDYDNKTVAWNIDVNKNHYVMKNWKLTDKLSDGLTLLPDTMKVYDVDAKYELVVGKDYELVYNKNENEFTLEFLNGYKEETTHAFTISYSTTFNTQWVDKVDQDKTFKNKASSAWLDEFGGPHESHDDATFDPNKPAKYNGFKNGSYNAQTRLITWEIGINYDGTDLDNAQIIDPILGNQQFVKGSVKIYHYTVNSDGSIAKGQEVSDTSDFVINEPSKRNNNTLTVNFPHGESAMYLVDFQTSVEGQLVAANYKNDAVFKNNDYPDHTLSAEVSVTHGGKLAVKSGEQDEDGFVNWKVTVNPSLSQVDDVVVTDRPSPNQSIDLDSVVILGTLVKSDGTLETNDRNSLVEGTDYTVELTTDNETGQQELKISFANQLNEAYVIKYRTMVLMTGNKDKVSNDVKITGNHEEQVIGGDNTEVDVIVSEGGGTAVGTKGSISFEKVNGEDQALQNAKFELRDKNDQLVIRTGTVDQNGKLTFGNLPYGTYILKEIEAPDGYSVSEELANGKKVTISKDSSRANIFEKLVNSPNKVTLTKQNGEHEALAGAVFKLQWQVGDSWIDIRPDESYTSDANGKLEVDGLMPANYRFIEIAAPNGYIINSDPIPFSVEKAATGVIPDVTVGPFINYQGSALLVKKGDDGKLLPGAIFKVVDASGETVQDNLVTDDDGQVEVMDLAPGDYRFIETKAPDGYILDTTPKAFTIKGRVDGKPEKVEVGEVVNYKGQAVLHKRDAAGDALEGAVFELLDKEGNRLHEVTSDENGAVTLNNLEPGDYQLVEILAPAGYLLNEQPILFNIKPSSDGIPKVLDLGVFVNYQGAVVLTKTDMNNRPLAGAEFDLIGKDEDVVASKLISNSDGKIEVSDLAPGNYYFVETKAPAGYEIDSKPIHFTIADTAMGEPEKFEISFSNHKIPEKVTPPDNKNPKVNEKVVIPNHKKKEPEQLTGNSKLPATGDTNTESGWLVLTGAVMLAGLLRYNKK
ncbi:SpaA isopeptide-forming pilin-related protein [Listeria rocourtiae]|uniref:SpaA isopeptide-forming pilin-related protein n=1 Tax=Listeria rocourtiae TaxID=647910 RepID=UPI003D2F569A